MKNIIILLTVLLFTSCVPPIEERCIEYCEDYNENFNKYLLHKYDGYHFTYVTDITPPDTWVTVKHNCPEMYEEFIAPVKVIWDSIAKIPIGVIQYEGLSDDIIKTKLRIKEIEKIRGKMKKSDNSSLEVGNTTYYHLDSIR